MMQNSLIQFPSQALKFAFDVGKSQLDFYGQVPTSGGLKILKGTIRNHPTDILKLFGNFQIEAKQVGKMNVKVVCEPTGIYHRQLMMAADRMHFETSFVSGEATARGKSFAKNTRNKTDEFDPMVIYKVSEIAPEIRRRSTSSEYDELKEWGRLEAICRDNIKVHKTELKEIAYRLFPNFPMNESYLLSKNGMSIFAAFGFEPAAIVSKGRVDFERKLKVLGCQIHRTSVDSIWEAASESAVLRLSDGIVLHYKKRMSMLYADLKTAQLRATECMKEMQRLIQTLSAQGERLPLAHKSLFTEDWIARIVAECGPLADFKDYHQLEKYAGMNLCENRSGARVGQVKQDKKGSSKLRRLFMELAFKLCVRRNCYGVYYQDQKSKGKSGKMAMTAVSRKLLKAFFGLSKSGAHFDQFRLHLTENSAKYKQEHAMAV